MRYYKITRQQAEAITYFEYGDSQAFDPFVGEQEDGSFLVCEDMYALLKDTEQFKRVDWSQKQLITEDQLTFKPEPL